MITHFLTSLTVDQLSYATVYCGIGSVAGLFGGALLSRPWLAYVGLVFSTALFVGLSILVQYAN